VPGSGHLRRRHRAAENALREVGARRCTFFESAFLRSGKIGEGSVNRYIAAGWIEVVGSSDRERILRLTHIGRSGLSALE
jgi:hypothetical protein